LPCGRIGWQAPLLLPCTGRVGRAGRAAVVEVTRRGRLASLPFRRRRHRHCAGLRDCVLCPRRVSRPTMADGGTRGRGGRGKGDPGIIDAHRTGSIAKPVPVVVCGAPCSSSLGFLSGEGVRRGPHMCPRSRIPAMRAHPPMRCRCSAWSRRLRCQALWYSRNSGVCAGIKGSAEKVRCTRQGRRGDRTPRTRPAYRPEYQEA